MKTLLFLATHFIDENVISEYRKMKNTPGVDAILAIDNTNPQIDFKNRVETKIFFDTEVQCFFFDAKLNDELGLPYFGDKGKNIFATTVTHTGDSKFYYVRKFFPAYDFYWGVEYDVFCNADTYAGFLEKFKDNRADLLLQAPMQVAKDADDFLHGLDWIYDDAEKIYKGIFAVVRLSARAIDFLYRRRLEQGEIFSSSTDAGKQWIFCETFVPTELIKGGFTCENLGEERVQFLPHIYLNDERIFLRPDNHLYHPVKAVKPGFKKMLNLYADLFFAYRKNFLIQLAEKLMALPRVNLKNFPVRFDADFNSMAMELSEKGGLRCEVWFTKERVYGSVTKIYAAVVFEGEFREHFTAIEKYLDLRKIPAVKILENDSCKMLSYSTETFGNVAQVAAALKILIDSTYDILREKIL